jgi:uncharacterized protein (TIGR03086 family)
MDATSTSSTTSARALLPAAARAFGERVTAVPADAWDAPTPCSDWRVHDLVGHLVSEHLWVPLLLGGATTEEVGDRFDGDVLGDDPVAAWQAAIGPSMDAWAATPDDATVQLSTGPTPAAEYAEQMLLDLTVHAWDLARGAGLPEELDAEIVTHVLAYVDAHTDELAGSGLFADAVPLDSRDPQDRLLAELGRRP